MLQGLILEVKEPGLSVNRIKRDTVPPQCWFYIYKTLQGKKKKLCLLL